MTRVEQHATDVQLADVVKESGLSERHDPGIGEPRSGGDAHGQHPDVEQMTVSIEIVSQHGAQKRGGKGLCEHLAQHNPRIFDHDTLRCNVTDRSCPHGRRREMNNEGARCGVSFHPLGRFSSDYKKKAEAALRRPRLIGA